MEGFAINLTYLSYQSMQFSIYEALLWSSGRLGKYIGFVCHEDIGFWDKEIGVAPATHKTVDEGTRFNFTLSTHKFTTWH